MTWTKELDEAAEMATKRGHWHTFLFYLLCGLAAIPTSFLVFSQVFTNATPDHWCSPDPELGHFGLSNEQLRKLTVPETNGVYETCKSYTIDIDELRSMLNKTITRTQVSEKIGASSSHLKITDEDLDGKRLRVEDAILAVRQESSNCSNGWTFSEEHYKRTLVTQFLLVCDKDWLPRTSNTLFWVGSIFGNLFFGAISDRYGRRPTILLMILIEVPLTIAASFSSNYWMYIALRVLDGLFFPALYQLPFILALELMPPAKRTYTGIVVGMLFASGMCLLALLAFFLRDWYHLSLATSVPFVFLFGYYWLIPESPRWLVGRGRVADAEKVYINLAKRNGITLPRGFLIELHNFFRDEDGDIDIAVNKNGYLQKLRPTTEELNDRRISNMITFQKQIKKEVDNIKVTENLGNEPEGENKMDECMENSEAENMEAIKLNTEMKHSNYDLPLSLKTEQQSTVIDLRKKSIQVVNRIFLNNSFEDVEEKKRIDDQNSEGDCRASPIDLFRYPNLRKKFLILTFNWVALGVVYNSLSYNTPNLGVDDYIAFFIGGAVELPSYFIAWFSMEKYGRRWVLSTFLLLGGLSCLSCVLVPETWPWVTVSLAMLGRLCAAASFAVFYVQIGELLPTVVRAQAMGASSFIAGVGLLACPYIVHLAVYSRSLPLIIMGVLSLVAVVTSLFLPETLNQPLPQTLGDGEMFGRNFKIFSFVEKG
ncbi:organic cation transporter 1-like [Aricia agestis]|uniref:organic cation transporter 1-like n=1 Tax=Aricia agestis TaxID=91739 RepID=UPI001C2026E7|nr:organic cation transporter 1-like [Aricia agestis]